MLNEKIRIKRIKDEYPNLKLYELKIDARTKERMKDECGRTDFVCTGCRVNSETIRKYNIQGERTKKRCKTIKLYMSFCEKHFHEHVHFRNESRWNTFVKDDGDYRK